MKRSFMVGVAGLLLFLSSAAWSYDTELAKGYEKLFAPVAGAKAGKALHLVPPSAFIKDIKAGKEFVVIDVRTPAEADVFTMSLPNSLIVPASELFHSKNLDRIPKDKPIMVVCQSGVRSAAVGTALRHIGFENVYILKGGFQALSSYYGPKEAYEELEQGK
jgi:rhodanese-related sulfurtransferase